MAPAKKPERTQRERREATVNALIDAARKRFALDGYAPTSLDDIAADAGVTKGGLYHHFPGGKVDLFRAVYEDEQRRIGGLTSHAFMQEKDPWSGLFAGFAAFFEESFDPGTQRITLIDAPAVLGAQALRDIGEGHAIGQVKEALRRAMSGGIIAERPVDPLAHLLFGAVCEAATMSARSPDPRASGRQALKELRSLLDAMRIDG